VAAPGRVEQVGFRLAVLSQPVDQPIVDLQHGEVQLRDEHVHVVAWIPDQRDALGVSGYVAGHALVIAADQHLDRVVSVVQEGVADGAVAVEAFKVGSRRAEVRDVGGIGLLEQQRAVGGDVVGDELPEKWPAGGDLGVIALIGVQAAVAGPFRPTEAEQELLVGVEPRQRREQAPVLAAAVLRRHADAARRREAVVAGDGRMRGGGDHGGFSSST